MMLWLSLAPLHPFSNKHKHQQNTRQNKRVQRLGVRSGWSGAHMHFGALHDVYARGIADPTQWTRPVHVHGRKRKKSSGRRAAYRDNHGILVRGLRLALSATTRTLQSRTVVRIKFSSLRTKYRHQHTNTPTHPRGSTKARISDGTLVLASPKHPGHGHGFSLARPVNNA